MTLCLTILFGAKVQAEEIQVDAMQAFREALTENASEDDRAFNQDLLFIGPTVQGELEFIAVAGDDHFDASGNLEFWARDNVGNVSDIIVPFYAKQIGKDMKIYFQLEKKWYQFQSPSLAAAVTDMVASPTEAELEEFITEVKEVNILRDTDKQRTMLIKIDGNRMAENIKAEAEKNPATDAQAADQDLFLKYLDTALRKADIWYMWTIDKRSGKTMNFSVHLSNLIQEMARAALDDDSQNWDEGVKDIFADIAFYSDTKSFVTFLSSDAKKKIEIPKNVLKAKPVEHLVGNANKK